jgi:transcriptional regulator with XRE-family HTH domain
MDTAEQEWNDAPVPTRTWAEVVQKLLRDSGLSGLELAKRAKLDKNVISRISTGRTPKPTYKTLRKIGLALGKSLEELEALRWESAPPDRSIAVQGVSAQSKVSRQGDLTATTVPASEQADRERGRSLAETDMLRRLGAHGYTTASMLAGFIEDHPDDAKAACLAIQDLLKQFDAQGVPQRPKAAAPLQRRRK